MYGGCCNIGLRAFCHLLVNENIVDSKSARSDVSFVRIQYHWSLLFPFRLPLKLRCVYSPGLTVP